MLQTRSSRPLTLAALALGAALLIAPHPTRADGAASGNDGAGRQESLWSQFLAWLDLTVTFSESSPHLDPDERPGSTTDSSPHIDPLG